MDGTFAWVRDALRTRGYRAKDLARAWGISESSTSRWFSGEEQPDLPLSRAVTLAFMLDITLDELAKGLGFKGKKITPPEVTPLPQLPVNSMNLQMLDDDHVRITLCQECNATVAMKVIQLLSVK